MIVRGSGALGLERQREALELLRAGRTQEQVARKFGVSKNTISGLWARHGEPVASPPPPPTLYERLDKLHARLDRVLAQTRGVGILAPEPRTRR